MVTQHEKDGNYSFDQVYDRLTAHQKRQVQCLHVPRAQADQPRGMLKHLGGEAALAPCYIPSMVVTVTVSGNVLLL